LVRSARQKGLALTVPGRLAWFGSKCRVTVSPRVTPVIVRKRQRRLDGVSEVVLLPVREGSDCRRDHG
jgi:hypothetical protein